MIVIFAEKEMEHINTKKFRWTIKDDCPDNIKKRLKKKLDYLYSKEYDQGNPMRYGIPKEE